VSEAVVISFAEFQEYRERRRQPVIELTRPGPSQPTEMGSPALPSDKPPHQELSSETPLPSADDAGGDVRLMPRGASDF